MAAVLALIVGAVAAVQLTHTPNVARTTPPTLAPAIKPPGSLAPSTSSPSTATGGIPAKVDPAIVDITTVVAGGHAAGTGMILSSGGEVLTNNHVIDGATSITVSVGGTSQARPASIVGYDATHDVAVIQIADASNLPAVSIGDSGAVAIGDPVVALGNALGRGGVPAVANGKVTGLDQTVTASGAGAAPETLHNMIETNAQIQPGDSGGPLVDSQARVIGMDTAGSTTGRSTKATLGYAIPINNALDIAHQIEKGQSSSTIQIGTRGIVGVQVGESTTTPGALVKVVEAGSPAEKAGLAAGDVITKVRGRSIDSSAAMGQALTGARPGDRVDITWVDGSGANHTATISLIPGPPN
ncbi:MAG: S1C family serine protease [Candidatus Dormibacteria bacterium]